MTTTEPDPDAERRLLATVRGELHSALHRIANRLAELEDGTADDPSPDVEPDASPWLEMFDADGRWRWHVLAPTTSAANPRTISGSTQGYSRAVDLRRSVTLTLEAILRTPGSTGTLAAYLRELDPTSTLAAGLLEALTAEPRR